jgi:hypothetical protein
MFDCLKAGSMSLMQSNVAGRFRAKREELEQRTLNQE